jgi:hypothetical protein
MTETLEWEPSVPLDRGLREVYRYAASELDAEPPEAPAGGGTGA